MVSFNAINREKKTKKRIVIRFQNSIRKRKTKKKLKIFFFEPQKKKNGEHKVNSNSVSFLTRKNVKLKWKSNLLFHCKENEKRKYNLSFIFLCNWKSVGTKVHGLLLYHCACLRELFNVQSRPHINPSGQDSLTNISFRALIFRSGLEARSNKNSITNPVSTEYRLHTG